MITVEQAWEGIWTWIGVGIFIKILLSLPEPRWKPRHEKVKRELTDDEIRQAFGVGLKE